MTSPCPEKYLVRLMAEISAYAWVSKFMQPPRVSSRTIGHACLSAKARSDSKSIQLSKGLDGNS